MLGVSRNASRVSYFHASPLVVAHDVDIVILAELEHPQLTPVNLLLALNQKGGSVLKVWALHLDTLLYKGYLNNRNRSETLPIGGKWLPGTYDIWVSSYEKNASFPYLLEITETRAK